MTSRFSKLFVVFLGFLLTVQPGFAQTSFSAVVAFGDSLTDAGNFFLSTNTAAQSGRGYSGTWAMQLAAKLGYNLTPSNSGGTDFAVAGQNTAQTQSQVVSYLSGVGGVASPTALYGVVAGINDLGGGNSSNVDAIAVAAADNLKNAIITLINAGAKNIIWMNLPSMQLSPDLQGNAVMIQGVATFNAQWATDIAALRSSYPSVNLIALDVYTEWQLLAKGVSFVFGYSINSSQGFTQAPASVPHSAASSNPDADYFTTWDGKHPTTFFHSIIAANCYAALTGTPVAGTYNIANLNSGLDLDTVGGSTSNGATVDQATPNSNSATQKWDLINLGMSPNQYMVVNDSNGRLLDVYGGATNNGAAVVVWDSNRGANQQWIISPASSGSYTLTGQQSGNVLDVYGFSTANGGTVNMWAPNGGANQKWLLQRLDQSPQPK